MIIILWVYLAGILPVLLLGARILGRAVPEIYRRADDYDFPAAQCVGWGLLIVIAAGAWPVAVPFAHFFFKGTRDAVREAELRKQLQAAEAEINQIKRREGWR